MHLLIAIFTFPNFLGFRKLETYQGINAITGSMFFIYLMIQEFQEL